MEVTASSILRIRGSFPGGSNVPGSKSISYKDPSIRGTLPRWGKGGHEAAGVSQSQGQGRYWRPLWGGGVDSNFIVYGNTSPWGAERGTEGCKQEVKQSIWLFFFLLTATHCKDNGPTGVGCPQWKQKDQSGGCCACWGERCWWPWGQSKWMGWLVQSLLERVLQPRQSGPESQELWLTTSHPG